MTRKPEIQYIGQFYVHGSEARQLETAKPKKPKTRLPIAKLEKIEKVYVDPVALVAIAVAVVMLVVMVMGVLQIKADWEEYAVMASYVHQLKQTNHEKTEEFRGTYDLQDIRVKANAMGMIPKSDAETMTIRITEAERVPEPTFLDNVRWFLGGLFA